MGIKGPANTIGACLFFQFGGSGFLNSRRPNGLETPRQRLGSLQPATGLEWCERNTGRTSRIVFLLSFFFWGFPCLIHTEVCFDFDLSARYFGVKFYLVEVCVLDQHLRWIRSSFVVRTGCLSTFDMAFGFFEGQLIDQLLT